MTHPILIMVGAVFASFLLLGPGSGTASAAAHAMHNPCAVKNPCATKKNPCAARNPCAAKPSFDSSLITRPAGYQPYKGDHKQLVAEGERLFKSTALSTNGLSCNSCHQNHNMYGASFAQPYPHTVAMARDQAGLKTIHLDEMVQACMVMPMAAEPLPWGSRDLAALTAYTAEQQKTFKPGKAAKNPCAARNPCAAKNPCAVKNPCAAKNPCAVRNPCAMKK